MGLLSFIKEAGEKLFSKGQAQTAMTAAQADPSSAEKAKAANNAAGDAILGYIDSQGLKATGLTVTFDGATAVATVYGVADSQATKEKIVLCCGNVQGVASVNDQMTVDQSEPEALKRIACPMTWHQRPRQTPSGPVPLMQREPSSQSPSS